MTSGVLRAPTPSALAPRISETAAPTSARGLGWIERALLETANGGTSLERVTTVAADIRRLRVGGAFWSSSPQWPAGVRFVIKQDQRRHIEAAVALLLQQTSPDQIGVLLPQAPWSARMAHQLALRGLSCHRGEADPWAVLDQARQVVVGGDDELGFLALLAGRAVQCLTPGYLTGWGLTEDHPGIPARGRRDVLQLAAAVLIEGVRYIDPFTGRITSCETTVERLADWRRIADEDRNLACLAGVAWWKRNRLRRFIAPGSPQKPVLDSAAACVARAKMDGGDVAVWPSLAPPHLTTAARETGVALRQIEDGFVRSVGLGSDLLPPCSIVIDRRGIYYDPSRPSDLEAILTDTDFSDDLQTRARALIDRLLANRLTKYNTGGDDFVRPAAGRVVLVPGQVEDDQSWRLGGATCAGNLDLVRRVRRHEPEAYIIYRPHPDVEAGNRVGAVPDAELAAWVNRIDRTSSMPALLDGVDAVHTLTSLAGFEALLRGREVIVHGQPFYSGWGLTHDLAPPPRRGRQLNIAELVAGTLLLYPRYLDPVTKLLCPPEVLIDRLIGLSSGPSLAIKTLRGLRRRFETTPSAAALKTSKRAPERV